MDRPPTYNGGHLPRSTRAKQSKINWEVIFQDLELTDFSTTPLAGMLANEGGRRRSSAEGPPLAVHVDPAEPPGDRDEIPPRFCLTTAGWVVDTMGVETGTLVPDRE